MASNALVLEDVVDVDPTHVITSKSKLRVGHVNSSIMSEAFIEFGAHTILIVIKSVVGEPIVHAEFHPIVELTLPEVTSCEWDDSEETLRRSRNPLIHFFC